MAAVVGEIPEHDPHRGRDLIADGVEAVEKAQADTATEARTFTHGGETFVLSPVVDMRVVVASQRGNFSRALELALEGGSADVDRILNSDEPLDPERFNRIFTDWMTALGTSEGESSASSSS